MTVLQMREDALELLRFTDKLSKHPERMCKFEALRYVQEMFELAETMSERLRGTRVTIHPDTGTNVMDRQSKDNGCIVYK